jgi:hypothetical protein
MAPDGGSRVSVASATASSSATVSDARARSPRQASRTACAVRSIGSRARAPDRLARSSWRRLIACQESSSQSTIAATVANQPQRKLTYVGLSIAPDAPVTRRSSGAAAVRPEAISVARLVSSRPDGSAASAGGSD